MDLDLTSPSTDAKVNQFLSALTTDDTGITLIDGISIKSVTINPPSMATTADGTVSSIAFPGAAVGDGVILIPPYDMQEIIYSGAVSAADTLEAAFYNASAGTVDLASSAAWIAIVLHRA
jgi:hypothetical protein